MCSRPFETRSRPRSLAATLALCLLCRFSQKLHSTSRFAHLCRSRPRGSVHSLLPSSLYVDHSHCLVLAPATLAALPAMSLTRDLPIRSVGFPPTNAVHPPASQHGVFIPFAPLKLARLPPSLAATLAVLPSISENPFPRFRRCNGKRTRRRESSHRSWVHGFAKFAGA
jgi:hypothetical protein